jgi:hypothetical protein
MALALTMVLVLTFSSDKPDALHEPGMDRDLSSSHSNGIGVFKLAWSGSRPKEEC